MKKVLTNPAITRTLDILFAPLTLFVSIWFKYCRMLHPKAMPVSEAIFMRTGVLPVRDHYYQPLVNPRKHLKKSLREDRHLPGINWNIEEQLSILNAFCYNEELLSIPRKKTGKLEFYFHNNSYLAGDAEYLYNIIRLKKPRKVIEVGCGYSSLMIQKAIKENKDEESRFACEHICIEPFEMPWLEQLKIEIVRKKVEELPVHFFQQLSANDILFIDSSHIIRPQGDVLFEFLEILPVLNPGVIVHVHDVFSPKDYLDEWVYSHVLWNEQYLLEAFLTNNTSFKVIGALNFLKHHYFDLLASKSPHFTNESENEPGSFWIQKV